MAEQSFKIYKDTAERLDKNALDIGLLKEDTADINSRFSRYNLFDKDIASIVNMMCNDSLVFIAPKDGVQSTVWKCEPNTTYTISWTGLSSNSRYVIYSSKEMPTVNGLSKALRKINMSNTVIRYTVGRYGSLNAGWTARGYKGYKYGVGRIGLSDILPKYTGGGFPEDGVFMANHEEMVGKFSNGRTAVANNNQIVDGISKGVYEAMLKAQSENTRETDLLRELIEAVKRGSRIVVDGRELVNVYDKRKNRNGHSFT